MLGAQALCISGQTNTENYKQPEQRVILLTLIKVSREGETSSSTGPVLGGPDI